MKRKPTTPGEILKEEYLKPLGLTQQKFANHIGCDVKVVNRLINGRTSLSADMAIRFAVALNTSAEFWLNAQMVCDLYNAEKNIGRIPKRLVRHGKPSLAVLG